MILSLWRSHKVRLREEEINEQEMHACHILKAVISHCIHTKENEKHFVSYLLLAFSTMRFPSAFVSTPLFCLLHYPPNLSLGAQNVCSCTDPYTPVAKMKCS